MSAKLKLHAGERNGNLRECVKSQLTFSTGHWEFSKNWSIFCRTSLHGSIMHWHKKSHTILNILQLNSLSIFNTCETSVFLCYLPRKKWDKLLQNKQRPQIIQFTPHYRKWDHHLFYATGHFEWTDTSPVYVWNSRFSRFSWAPPRNGGTHSANLRTSTILGITSPQPTNSWPESYSEAHRNILETAAAPNSGGISSSWWMCVAWCKRCAASSSPPC